MEVYIQNDIQNDIQNEGSSSVNKCEETYITVVLQSLSVLMPIKNDFLNDEPLPSNQTTLSNNFKKLLYALFNTQNNTIFQDFMNSYFFYAQNNNNSQNSSEPLLHDPYHFLKYLLIFLNSENNKPKDYNYFKKYEKEKSNSKHDIHLTFNSFKNYCINTQNSIISKNIYYSQIEQISCNNCSNRKTYYNCSLNPILEIDIDKIKSNSAEMGNQKISLSECLKYYFEKSHQINCLNCNNMASALKKLVNDSKVLIIYLNRSQHNGQNDVNIDLKIDLSEYFIKDLIKCAYIKYSLKSCIFYSGNIENGYFCDYCV